MSKPQKKVSDQDLIRAREVLGVVGSWLDSLAADPELAPQVAIELMQNYEEIFDALLAITEPKFRVIIYDLGRKVLAALKQLDLKAVMSPSESDAEKLGREVRERLMKAAKDYADYSRGLGLN